MQEIKNDLTELKQMGTKEDPEHQETAREGNPTYRNC